MTPLLFLCHSHPAINLAMVLNPLIFDTRYIPRLPPYCIVQLVHTSVAPYFPVLISVATLPPIPSPSLGAGLLWLVGTRARKSDIGRKQVHSCVLQEATKGLSNRTVASPTPNSSLCQWSLIHPDHPLPPPPDRAHLWQNWKEQNLCWKVRHRISPLSSHRPLQHPAPVIGEHLLLEMVQNSTEGSSYMTDIWLTTILPHKNHVKPNASTSLICPGSNQNIFLWQVHCLNRSNFFTKCKNRKVWASVPNFLVCQLIDCTVVDNLSKAKMSPIVTGVPWH